MPASKSQSLDKWMRISHPRRRAHSFLQITPQAVHCDESKWCPGWISPVQGRDAFFQYKGVEDWWKRVEALLKPWKGLEGADLGGLSRSVGICGVGFQLQGW